MNFIIDRADRSCYIYYDRRSTTNVATLSDITTDKATTDEVTAGDSDDNSSNVDHNIINDTKEASLWLESAVM